MFLLNSYDLLPVHSYDLLPVHNVAMTDTRLL